MIIPNYDLVFRDGLPYLLKVSSTEFLTMQVCGTASDAVNVVNAIFHLPEKCEEYVIVIALNTHNDVLGVSELSHGTATAAITSPREIMQRLLLIGATKFIIVHNHPSGSLEISKEDYEMCTRMLKASDIMRISFLDSIIIGGKDYVSFASLNLLKDLRNK